MSEAQWISLGVQIPVVLAFIWFALQIVKTFVDAIKQIMESFSGSLQQVEKTHAEGMSRLAEEVKQNTTKLAEVIATVTSSEARNNEIIYELLRNLTSKDSQPERASLIEPRKDQHAARR